MVKQLDKILAMKVNTARTNQYRSMTIHPTYPVNVDTNFLFFTVSMMHPRKDFKGQGQSLNQGITMTLYTYTPTHF